MLAMFFTVELFVSRMLPPDATTRYTWAGNFWHPAWWESLLFVLMNIIVVRAAAGTLSSDLGGRLSLLARRVVMTVALCAASFLGAQALYGWLIFSHEGGRYAGGQGLPGALGHAAILFQAVAGFTFLRWTASQLGSLGRARGAARARMASMSLVIALGARGLAFETGTTVPALAVVVGLTAMLYVIHQVRFLEGPSVLLLAARQTEDVSPQL